MRMRWNGRCRCADSLCLQLPRGDDGLLVWLARSLGQVFPVPSRPGAQYEHVVDRSVS
jgi:hypothetical protein